MTLPIGTYVACGSERRLGFIRGACTCQRSSGQIITLYIVELDVGFYSEDKLTWVVLLPCHPDGVAEVHRELQHE
jgi:hypothetical protein